MSLRTICDKCEKPIDQSEAWVQIVQTGLVDEDGTPTVSTPAETFDYHVNHAPKLTKAKPEEPAAPEPAPEPPVEPEPEPEPT
jgi:hypothetical protein